MKRTILIVLFMAMLLTACGQNTSQKDIQSAVQATLTAWPTTIPTTGSGALFDDFAYTDSDDANLKAHGWTPRSSPGGPGIPGAAWAATAVTFMDDPNIPGNRLMQLASSTDGSGRNTTQTELYHQRKFYEGTYASRVRFTDEPVFGPDGDNIVETFFTITPLNYPLEPDYGEIDFEYLPNGGWGDKDHIFWLTTWETYQNEPWQAVNDHGSSRTSFDGWHTLLAQVSGVRVKYYIDGQPMAEHGDKYYPETPMSINFNLWFIDGGMIKDSSPRKYIQQADWVFYAGNEVLTQQQVDQRIVDYRAAKVAHVDTVPAWTAQMATVLLTPTPAITSTPAPAGPRPFEKEIHKVSGVKIDGELTDWPAEPTFTLSEQSQVVYLAPDVKWDGPKDLSALIWAGWADDGLYLAAKVTDDQVFQAEIDTNIWQGDYLELQLDSQLEADFDDPTMSADDLQFGFSPGDFGKTQPVSFEWIGPMPESTVKDIQQAQTKTADGYIIEVFIPKELLPQLILKEGAVFGMNINPSDSDGNPQEIMMSTSLTRARDNPTTFGKFILLGK